MHVIFQQNIIRKNLHWLRYTVNSRLVDTPLLQTLAITDKIQIPGKSYRGLTGNDSSYYGLSLLRNYGHFLGTKVTILLFRLAIKRTCCTSHVTLSCKITVCSVHHLPKYISKDFWNVQFHIDSLNCLHNHPHLFT